MTKNKIALVTGGSRGLGKNTALSLAKKGIDIILTYKSNQAEAEKVVSEILSLGQKAIAFRLDTSDTNQFDRFFDQITTYLEKKTGIKNFDYLVNNAGIGIYKSFEDTTEEDFDALSNIQFKGVFFLTQKALPFLNEGASIVNISTGLTRFSLPGYAAYASMKGAIETLTKYLAKELGSRQIRVNVVAPGAIETDFGGGVVRDNAQLNGFIASQTALGRVGLPDDIGSVVAFLCSDDSKWINAQRIEVSGGQFL